MPVILPTPVRRLSQVEFGDLAYSVMACVFEIHREMGRFFDEKIYKRELAHRHAGVQLEFPIQIVHATFKSVQYIDALVGGGGPFEFKAVHAITPRHPAQLLNYMLLAELDHGKLVNLRKNGVEHEFVNTTLRHEDRIRFSIVDSRWNSKIAGAETFRAVLTAILRDWGTGLGLDLYEEALTHFLGGEARVLSEIEIRVTDRSLGRQKMRLAAPRVAFVLTALSEAIAEYEIHTRRLLHHAELDAVLWANIGLKTVAITTIE